MLPWIQKEEYLKNVGYLPEEYPPDSEAGIQWRYNPRTKESREYFNATFGRLKTLHADKKQKSKGYKKTRAKKKRT